MKYHYFRHTEHPRLNTAFDSHHLSLLVAELHFFKSLENGFPCLIQSTCHYDGFKEHLQHKEWYYCCCKCSNPSAYTEKSLKRNNTILLCAY